MPFLALMGLVGLVLAANTPTALAIGWDGAAMAPLPQYRTYCQTYGDRDPGCAAALGGRSATPLGVDRLSGKPDSLTMAVHIHRQVVADLIYVKEPKDVWQVLGTVGTGMTGDCDDVVMTTISRLLRRGYPRAALRATIVELPEGGGYHLILGVRMPEGEVFLDDRHRWQRTAAELTAAGYRFVAQEVPGQSLWRRPGPALPLPRAGETVAALAQAASPGV
ncbi:transglutaminase-like cysteine peptidase [Niveispirillum sp. SYP-B3756]|uniref:transglutaminase-like cysteine peptidase n=1 Tax=Niveispirillum sp. SYP-B3756 TaxID=2662178 RepID=UPI0015638A0E|nr:transglutaminase-like cysteine peptidase [Niveispirillum sp. SYP-B3756]